MEGRGLVGAASFLLLLGEYFGPGSAFFHHRDAETQSFLLEFISFVTYYTELCPGDRDVANNQNALFIPGTPAFVWQLVSTTLCVSAPLW